MHDRRARVLLVESSDKNLSRALRPALERHEVEVARDAFDAIDRIDCARIPYDVIFCDLCRADLPGPELWAYLLIARPWAAERIVFIASGSPGRTTRAFLEGVPNCCLELPADAEALDALANRRASSSAETAPESGVRLVDLEHARSAAS